MSNDKFNKSFFSNIFTENDFFVDSWATNVYNKIKRSKILPNYIHRNMDEFKSDVVYSDSGVSTAFIVSDTDFSNGNCLFIPISSKLNLSNEINIGSNFDLSFEIKIDPSTEPYTTEINFGNFLSIVRELSPDRFGFYINGTFRGYNEPVYDLLVVRIVRNNLSYKLYINNVLNASFDDATVADIIISNYLVEVSNETNAFLSNIKILSFDNKKILHWWHLNVHENNNFIDVGLNDYDFYTFFYSISKMFSYIVRFSKYLKLETIDQNFLERYLSSKSINYNRGSNYSQLIEMFNLWKKILNERGSDNIIRKKDLVENYSFLGYDIGGDYAITSSIQTPVNLGKTFIIEFDIYVEDDLSNYDLLDCLSITKTGGLLTLELEIIDSGNELTARLEDREFVDGIYNIKIIKTATTFSIYIDDIYYSEDYYNVTIISPDFVFTNLFVDWKKGHNLNNLSLKYTETGVEKEIKYEFNERDTIFLNDISKTTNLEARLFALDDIGGYLMDSFFATNLFDKKNNYEYKEIDGELRQIYEATQDTELVLARAGIYDLSWVIGYCSPMENQTYPIKSFNKLPNKNSAIAVLSQYPLRSVTDKLEIDFADCYCNDDKIKITNFPLVMTPIIKASDNYLKRWKVPCMAENSYELSFRIKIEGDLPDFNMFFGIDTSVTNSAVTGTGLISFFSSLNFDRVGDFWVRGIIYGKNENISTKPKRMSFNSLTNHLKFKSTSIDPIVGMELKLIGNVGNDCTISLYDFQFRLLSINQTKVTIGNKDLLFLYGRNNSSNSETDIFEKTDKIIPFSSTLKILTNA